MTEPSLDHNDWNKRDIEAVRFSFNRDKEAGGVPADIATDASLIFEQFLMDGKLPFYNSDLKFDVSADIARVNAVHAAMDAALAVKLQRRILIRLQSLKLLSWVIIALLAYIAWKVS